MEEWKDAEVRRSRMSVLVDSVRLVMWEENSAGDGGCTAGK